MSLLIISDCRDKKHRAWRVRIFFCGKQRHVGRYRDDVTAARAYDKAAAYLYGSKAILNFSMEVRPQQAETCNVALLIGVSLQTHVHSSTCRHITQFYNSLVCAQPSTATANSSNGCKFNSCLPCHHCSRALTCCAVQCRIVLQQCCSTRQLQYNVKNLLLLMLLLLLPMPLRLLLLSL
jgi:hypothetical protein